MSRKYVVWRVLRDIACCDMSCHVFKDMSCHHIMSHQCHDMSWPYSISSTNRPENALCKPVIKKFSKIIFCDSWKETISAFVSQYKSIDITIKWRINVAAVTCIHFIVYYNLIIILALGLYNQIQPQYPRSKMTNQLKCNNNAHTAADQPHVHKDLAAARASHFDFSSWDKHKYMWEVNLASWAQQ